jgi:hypothetical protein
MVGIEKHYVEKELIKFLRKYLESSGKDLPVKSVLKKRGQTFGFLNFESDDQKKEFSEVFETILVP